MPGLLPQGYQQIQSPQQMGGVGPSPGSQVASQAANVSTGTSVVPLNPSSTLSRNNPLPGQNYLPTGFSDLSNAKLGETSDWFSQQMNHGLGQPANNFSTTNTGQAGSSDPMVQAIQGMAAKNYGSSLTGLQNQNNQAATVANSNQETGAANLMGADYANQVQNFNQQYTYEIQRNNLYNQYITNLNNAQAGVIGSVLGGIAQVAGSVAAA